MKRAPLALVMATAVSVASVALGGCSASTPQNAPGTEKIWGYVASANKTQLDVNESQVGVTDFVVRRVLVPSDGWVVVTSDLGGKPGTRLGLTPVKRGESLDVRVALDKITTPNVIVSLYADRGTPGQFDLDMLNKEMSADRPFLVNGSELRKSVAVRAFGVPIDVSQASIVASDQIGATKKMVVSRVVAPSDAWLVVNLDQDGSVGERVGLRHVRAGVSTNVAITLDPVPFTPSLRVALHTDAGDPGLFNFDVNDMINSPDQPFYVNGEQLAIKVRVK